MGDCPARGVSLVSEITKWLATTRTTSSNPLFQAGWNTTRINRSWMSWGTPSRRPEMAGMCAAKGENSTAWGIDPNDWLAVFGAC